MKDEAIYRRLFRTALLIRLVEERIIELYPSDKIQSPVHLSIGQEAVAVGVCDALRPDDLVFATYRSHGFYIAKGGHLDAMFAELYGRKGGISGGKAGSMHLAAPQAGLMGSSAVVASTIPHAVGAALSFKRRGSSRIAVAVFGDGANDVDQEKFVFYDGLFPQGKWVQVAVEKDRVGLTSRVKHPLFDLTLVDRRIEVYSQPSAALPVPAYASFQTYQPGDAVPLVLDGATAGAVAVADLLP